MRGMMSGEFIPFDEESPEPEPTKRPSREGMRYVGAHVPEESFEKLHTLAFKSRREKQDLMREALDLLFERYGTAMTTHKRVAS